MTVEPREAARVVLLDDAAQAARRELHEETERRMGPCCPDPLVLSR